jgi:hypothetical protein
LIGRSAYIEQLANSNDSIRNAMTKRKTILITFAVVLIAVLLALGVLVGAAIYSHQAADRAAYEAATIQNMKTIAVAETQYFDTRNHTYATIDQLVREQMLTAKEFARQPPVADGYVFTLKLNQADSYSLEADPVDRASGKRHFYFDSASTQIRVNPDGRAGPGDPLL